MSPTAPLWAQLQRGEPEPVSSGGIIHVIVFFFLFTWKLTVLFLLQVRALLDQVSEKLATFSEVGISPAHADHIFCELTTYEERVCVSNTQPLTIKALSNRSVNTWIISLQCGCVVFSLHIVSWITNHSYKQLVCNNVVFKLCPSWLMCLIMVNIIITASIYMKPFFILMKVWSV